MIRYEKGVFMFFCSGRRSHWSRKLELCHILEVVIGASEEPVLEFAMNPCIEFGIPVITRVQNSIPQEASAKLSPVQDPYPQQESTEESTP